MASFKVSEVLSGNLQIVFQSNPLIFVTQLAVLSYEVLISVAMTPLINPIGSSSTIG